MSDTNRDPIYQGLGQSVQRQGLGPSIQPGSPDDWTAEQLDRLGANRKPRRTLQPDGTLSLTREEAMHIVTALLFYLRAWQDDPTDDDRSVPTEQLIADQGRHASDVLDADIFPVEVVYRAMQVWDERWS